MKIHEYQSRKTTSPTPKSKSPIIKSYVDKKQNRSINLLNRTQHLESNSRLSCQTLQTQSKLQSTAQKSKSTLKMYDTAKDVLVRTKKQIQLNQKFNPNKNEKLFHKVIFYSNHHPNQIKGIKNFRVQAFFNDGTSVSWKNQTLVFLSSKAIKTRVNITDSYRSQDLSYKLIKIIHNLKKYNDSYLTIEERLREKIIRTIKNSKIFKENTIKELIKQVQKQGIFKKYKIDEFYWEKCRINQTQEGYEIQSNDQNAKMTLLHDLFRIKVEYLQLTNGRKVKGIHNKDSDNEDNPLDKYTFYPPIGIESKKKKSQTQIWYQYHKVQKQFSVFNLPNRWFYPIDQIWTYLLANKIIKHDFIYIDFIEQDISLTKTTQMPTSIIIGQKHHEETQDHYDHEITNLPLYAKPTHDEKCKWVSFQYHPDNQNLISIQRIIWFNSQSEQNLYFDGYGFWKSSSDGNSVLYKTKNCFDNVVKYHFGAIPMTVRLPNQPQRALQSSLTVFNSYIEHNRKLQNSQALNHQQNASIESNIRGNKSPDQVIFDESLPEIGQFKVYGNGTIVGKFIDRTMLTLKGQMITIIDDMGQSISININKKQMYADKSFQNNVRNPYVRYREHLRYVSDFYERFFHYQQWINKQKLLQGLSDLKIANQAFLNVCQNIKKH